MLIYHQRLLDEAGKMGREDDVTDVNDLFWSVDAADDGRLHQIREAALQVKMNDIYESGWSERTEQAKKDFFDQTEIDDDYRGLRMLLKPRGLHWGLRLLQKQRAETQLQTKRAKEEATRARSQGRQPRRAAEANGRGEKPGQTAGAGSQSGQPPTAAETGSRSGQPEHATDAGSRGAPEGRFWSASESDSEEEVWDEDPPTEQAAKPAQPAQMSVNGKAAAKPAQPARMSADGGPKPGAMEESGAE